MKKSVVLVILFLFCFGCSRNKPSKYAIVYGIADYSNVEINLAYSANDAISVSRLLEKYGYTVILRTDTTATIKNLEADFSTMAGIVDDNDLFMFYFSGHGLSKQTLLDFGDSTAPDDYFAMLLNHQFTYSNMLDYIKENSVSNGKLTQLMSRISKGIKIAVIDACYSGGAITNRPVVDYSPDDFNGHYGDDPDLKTILDDAGHIYKTNVLGRNGTDPGYMILSSCGRNEISWDGFFSHSVFSFFFLKAAEQGDINGDGVITALEIYSFTSAVLKKYWNTPTQNADWNFLPKITGSAEDIILFDQPMVVGQNILNIQ